MKKVFVLAIAAAFSVPVLAQSKSKEIPPPPPPPPPPAAKPAMPATPPKAPAAPTVKLAPPPPAPPPPPLVPKKGRHRSLKVVKEVQVQKEN